MSKRNKLTKSAKELKGFMSSINKLKVTNIKGSFGKFYLDLEEFRETIIDVPMMNLIAIKLDSSCNSASRRGGSDYREGNYGEVTCQWSTSREMKLGIMELDKKVIIDFVLIAIRWIMNGGNDRDLQPCFSRPKDEGNYVVGNIVAKTIAENRMELVDNSLNEPCMLIVLANFNLLPLSIGEFPSINKAAEYVKKEYDVKVTLNTLKGKASSGVPYDVMDNEGNNMRFLFQTKISKKPNYSGALKICIKSKTYFPC